MSSSLSQRACRKIKENYGVDDSDDDDDDDDDDGEDTKVNAEKFLAELNSDKAITRGQPFSKDELDGMLTTLQDENKIMFKGGEIHELG